MISGRRRILSVPRVAVAGGLLFAVASINGCKSKEQAAIPPAAVVQAAHPTIGPISEEIAADALLAPLAQAAIAARISAPILHEYVQRGQHVTQGQLLISLDDRDLRGAAKDGEGAVTTARATLSSAVQAVIPEDTSKAEGDVRQAEAALDVAQRTANERKRLLKEGAISGRDYDSAAAAAVQAQVTSDIAKKHLEGVLSITRTTSRQTAEGQLASAQGKLISAEAQVSYAQLRSPIAGIVTDRPLFPGETATAGTAIVTVMDTSSMLAKIHLALANAQKLRPLDKADVTIPGLDAPFEGTVMFLSPTLDTGSTTVEVWIKLANSRGVLKVGTPAHATLHTRAVPEALQVPSSALVPAADGGTAVMMINGDGAAHKRAVVTGVRAAGAVQILSGLSTSDMIITEGGYGLDDGTKVKVGKENADAAGSDGR